MTLYFEVHLPQSYEATMSRQVTLSNHISRNSKTHFIEFGRIINDKWPEKNAEY